MARLPTTLKIDTGGLEALVERMEAAAARVESAVASSATVDTDPSLGGGCPKTITKQINDELHRMFREAGQRHGG